MARCCWKLPVLRVAREFVCFCGADAVAFQNLGWAACNNERDDGAGGFGGFLGVFANAERMHKR